MDKIFAALLLIALILLALLAKAGIVAAATLAGALWPERIARVRARATTRPIRYFFIGFVDAFAALVLTGILGHIGKRVPPAGILMPVWLLVVATALTCGLAGVYGAVGERLGSAEGSNTATIRGGVAVECAGMAPFVGWVGHLAIACIALGAGVAEMLSFGRRSSAGESEEPPEDEEV